MTKRRLTAIRLDKIAAVDKPCQEHAVVAIVKRAATGDVPPAIAKKTFDEALRAQLVSEKIGDVFWRAFENQWAVRDAFRTALGDEIAEGGDGSASTAAFSAAMQQIAVYAAEAAREAAGTADADLESAVEAAITKFLTQQEQDPMAITTKAQLMAAVSKFDPNKSTVGEMNEIKKAATDLGATDALPVEGPLAIVATPAADTDKVAALETEIVVLKMAPAIRKHYDGLDAAGQTAFIKKSEADRQAEVDAIEKGDPIVHTCSDGTTIRKSDGATVLALAKRGDALAAENTALKSASTAGSIEKRAVAYPNIAKSVATNMLKSIDAVGADTDEGKAILATMDTMNKSRDGIFKSLGSGNVTTDGGTEDSITKARTTFASKVNEIAKRDNCGQSDAMSKARDEHAELFAEAYPAPVEEDA